MTSIVLGKIAAGSLVGVSAAGTGIFFTVRSLKSTTPTTEKAEEHMGQDSPDPNLPQDNTPLTNNTP